MNILIYIVILNRLHSVFLASFHVKSDWMSKLDLLNPSAEFKNSEVLKKTKPTCGPVSFPDFSCEGVTTLQPDPELTKEGDTWKPSDYLLEEPTSETPYETLYDVTSGQKEEILYYNRLSSMSTPHTTKFYEEEALKNINTKSVSHYEISQAIVTKNMTSSDKISGENMTPNMRADMSKSQGDMFPSETSSNVVTQSIQMRAVTYPIELTQSDNMSPDTKKYYSTTMTHPTVTKTNRALREKLQFIHRVIRTMSTYPPFPGGTTPFRDATPTEVLMCGIAKCLILNWTDPEAVRQNLQTKPVIPVPFDLPENQVRIYAHDILD